MRYLGIALSVFAAGSCFAQSAPHGYSLNGVPGLVDMPSAVMARDGEFTTSVSKVAGVTKTTLSFQITPKLLGSFRYSVFDQYGSPEGDAYYDRSFDLRYQLWREGEYRPALAVGLIDFVGTGRYSSEYVVASKSLGAQFEISAGLGWGRMGSYNGFENPLGQLDDRFARREAADTGLGGKLQPTQWFQGDAAFFGGVAWSPHPKLTFKAEYSTDAYHLERRSGLIERKSPMNYAVEYRPAQGARLQLYHLHGDQFGAGITLELNPKNPAFAGHFHEGPLPFKTRAKKSAHALGWAKQGSKKDQIQAALQQILAQAGLELQEFAISAARVELGVENKRYNSNAEALGRIARALSQALPGSVDTFAITLRKRGIGLSTTVLSRTDLEDAVYRPDAAEAIFARAEIKDSAQARNLTARALPVKEKLSWSVGPYVEIAYFDPDNPARFDFGLKAESAYEFAPNFTLSGETKLALVGNKNSSRRPSDSVLPHVRSDANQYDKANGAVLQRLTFDYYGRPAQDLYLHVAAGYLERMYAGVSAELLWKRVDLPFALGFELSSVRQRDFTNAFTLQDYQTVTGHASAYWQLPNDFHAQLDLGRYLAEDWGGTLSLDREFANGWRIGAYATLTDVPFEKFGEGSFDKGLRFTIPLTHFLGKPSRKRFSGVLQPLTRDGGAKLYVSGRLYETIRDAHKEDMQESWGRFWR